MAKPTARGAPAANQARIRRPPEKISPSRLLRSLRHLAAEQGRGRGADLHPTSRGGEGRGILEIMESSSSDVQMSHCAEDLNSESTIEIKIKTLDSQTYNLRVNKRVPVPLLKEKIATVTGILSEQQRLICRGRVLKDDELLSAYHVEDGHTLHLVVRQPGQSATSGNAGNEGTTSNPARRRGPTMTRSIVLEAINVGQGSELSVAQLLQSLLRAPSSTQVSSGPAPSDARPSEGAQSSTQNGVRAVLDQMPVPPLFQSETSVGLSEPNVIPDSLTTISQYINFLRDSFRREGFLENGQTLNNADHGTAGSAHGGGTQNHESQPDSASAHGLPTAALLAETMHSTRQLLVEHAGALLSQLPNQLGDIVNVTDATTRRNLQNSVVRYGVLIQYLGSLLLELGRTTMMLRINPATSEAVVNSGPALFISPSGPNPLMVQPAPFVPGTGSVQVGPIFSSLTSHRSVLHPRDIDIHVRTSTLGSPVDINAENGTQTSPGEQNGQGPFSQLMDSIPWIASLFSGENSRVNGTNQHAPASAEQVDGRNHGAPEVSGVSDEGLRFASLVRQIMPFISQVESHHQSASAVSSSTPSQAAHGNLNTARAGPSHSRSSHQHNRDPVDGPNSKRQRTSE
uniref:Ubiquitin-like domain-containing protein n=1 Tax=Oryza glumipatula TaxID=40148 RepID=A0A0E0ATI5_9ORYZ